MINRLNSNLMKSNDFKSCMLGAATLPLTFIAAQTFTWLARSCELTSKTYFEYYQRDFQTKPNPFVSPENGLVLNTLAGTFGFINSNLLISGFEELVFRKLLQGVLLTKAAKALNLNPRSRAVTITRLAVTTILFSLWHHLESGLIARENYFQNTKLTPKSLLAFEQNVEIQKQIIDGRNFQLAHTLGKGLVYGAIYEYTNQNIWASVAAHTISNIAHDLIVCKL